MAKEINGADVFQKIVDYTMINNAIRSENGMTKINTARSIRSDLYDTKEELDIIESTLNCISSFLVVDKGENSLTPNKEINDMSTHVSEMLSQTVRIHKKAQTIADMLGCGI